MQPGAVMLAADQRVLYVDNMFAALAGIARDRVFGAQLAKFIAEPDRDKLSAAISDCHVSPSQVEVRVKRIDGSLLSSNVTVISVTDGRCMCVFTDVAEHRRHLEADERNRKFLAILAHELRNMLGPIRTSVELLKLTSLEPQALRAVESIERQSNRILKLVEDLRAVNPKE